MKNTYDYNDLIDEIKEEIEDLILTKEDTLQVLRASKPILDDYYPIIDWYYSHNLLMEELTVEPDDSKKEIATKKQIRDHYTNDQPNLSPMKVSAVLSEIEGRNKLITNPFYKKK